MNKLLGFLLPLVLATPLAHATTENEAVANLVQNAHLDALLDADPLDVEVTPHPYGAYKITLGSVDAYSGAVTGVRLGGTAFTGTLTASTRFKPAPLNKFTPTDPCRDAVATYNSALSSGVLGGGDGTSGPFQVVTTLASLGCKARLVVDRTTLNINAFRPAN